MSATNFPVNWSNPVFEPKRNYRFIVPFPIHLPKREDSHTMGEIFKTRGDLRDPAISRYGVNCYYDTLAVTCTLPTVTTKLYRAPSIVGGFEPTREGHPGTYDFQPVELELIDTYSHDIQASLTAMLIGAARVTAPTGPPAQKSATSAKQIPIRNTDTIPPAPREFRITELLDEGRFAFGQPGVEALGEDDGNLPRLAPPLLREFKARQIILYNPYVTGITYGTLSYADTELPKVKVQIDYDYIDYRYISGRMEKEQGDYLRSYGREKGKIIWREMNSR
jgi:hypothetical protein|tara:strand:- start:2155 stop:2991 length:837 start_codon:yes stop_codon:yes gene_type:complete